MKIIAVPDSACPGDTITLTCEFHDSDADDDLLFTWHKSSGQFHTVASTPEYSIRWIAPDEPGTFRIRLTISDGEASVEDSIAIDVQRQTGRFTDTRDGHSYPWVKIGEQIWMSENLAYLPEVYPPEEGGYQEPFYYVQGYTGHDAAEAAAQENYSKYGVLYNWKAMQTACPDGWRPSTDADWSILEEYLGMSPSDLEETGDRLSGTVGKKLKSVSGWTDNGNGTNMSGFGVIPGGSRNANGTFGSIGMRGNFRTTTAGGSSFNFARILTHESDGSNRGTVSHNIGFSVRCLQSQIP